MYMVYRCKICGNFLPLEERPDPPAPSQGSKDIVRWDLQPICGKHQIPTTMQVQPQ